MEKIKYDRFGQIVTTIDERILKKFNIDIYSIYPGVPDEKIIDKENYEHPLVDAWGISYKKIGFHCEMIDHPLKNATIEDLRSYPWPDPLKVNEMERLKKEAKDLYENTDYAILLVSDSLGSLFERAWYLRGFEGFLMDLVSNQKFAEALMNKLLEINIVFLEECLSAIGDYIQIVEVGDDLSIQNGPLFSLDVYRRLIKPRQKELFKFIKARTKAKILYHSCGSVYPFIADLIDIGIDILNPVQVSAINMNAKNLKKEFGGKVTFWGAIDTQKILPHGSPEDVEAEVNKRIYDLAPGGGYVLASVHNIQSDVPPENICAMYRAAEKYGSYPIKI